MKIGNINGFEFFQFQEVDFNVVFFTAEGDANFNINTKDGIENLKKVKTLFGLDDIGYVKQIHSDIIWQYEGSCNEGDAIITNKSNIGLGVFTADCVPVILIDKEQHAVAAIHSGWKGTINEITFKTIKKMADTYGSSPKNLEVFIGPHIKSCCYKVGHELIEMFGQKGYDLKEVVEEDRLSLEDCIILQCKKAGILQDKIKNVNCCTMCGTDRHKFYSYRKNKDNGRLLSLVFLNKK
jgi:hypothetical protein